MMMKCPEWHFDAYLVSNLPMEFSTRESNPFPLESHAAAGVEQRAADLPEGATSHSQIAQTETNAKRTCLSSFCLNVLGSILATPSNCFLGTLFESTQS